MTEGAGVWVVRLWDSFGFRLLVVSGERFAACSVGALWPAFGWRVRDATRREVPLRPLDLSRVDLLLSGTAVTPDGSAAPPFAGWRRAELVLHLARRWRAKWIRDLTRQVCHVFVLRQFDVAAPVGERLRRSDGFTLYASNRLAPDRGFGARPGVSDGVYGLMRPHDHGMPGVILDTGSEAFLLGERPPVHSP